VAVLAEQQDEWQMTHYYMSAESLAKAMAPVRGYELGRDGAAARGE
jgi:hypothetical protein